MINTRIIEKKWQKRWEEEGAFTAKNNSDKNNSWYDYSSQKWANAVVVSNNKYNKNIMLSTNDIIYDK